MQFPSDLAFSLTDADPQKFNDAVSGGAYPCAPETKKGARRVFDAIDLIGLAAFAALTNNNGAGEALKPKQAGHMACSLVRRIRQGDRGLVSLHYVRTTGGENWILPYYGPHDKSGRAQYNPAGIDVVAQYGVSVAGILALLNKRLDEKGMKQIEI